MTPGNTACTSEKNGTTMKCHQHDHSNGSPVGLQKPCRSSFIQEVIDRVSHQITPVWPLEDYVAVNPVAGFSDRKFLDAQRQLRSVSSVELLMHLDYFRGQYNAGRLKREHINQAIDELVADGIEGIEFLDVHQVVAELEQETSAPARQELGDRSTIQPSPGLTSLVDIIDRYCSTHWSVAIVDEISKHCSAHYDESQSVWSIPGKPESLYNTWRSAATIDRNLELLGISGVRNLVAQLPADPTTAVSQLLTLMQVPKSLWYHLLLCEALCLPGWSAWTRYQDQMKLQGGKPAHDFSALLAMRLTYQLLVSRQVHFSLDWSSMAEHQSEGLLPNNDGSDQILVRYVLLKARENAVRSQVLEGIAPTDGKTVIYDRPLSQMVFCIDVRSERIRRQIENESLHGPAQVQTFGFAGFFGLPIEYVLLAENKGHSCVPVLITPQFKVQEELDIPQSQIQSQTVQNRGLRRYFRKAWIDFQSSAVSCFTFVEALGLVYGIKLLAKSMGFAIDPSSRTDGVAKKDRPYLGPALRGLHEQGVGTKEQLDLAESMLRGIGLVQHFARLVVFCGHGSQGQNNPLQACLDCGACGGHTGEANARMAAKILNQEFIRQGLAARGIVVPPDVHFLAGLHNTTTDEIRFYDLHLLPDSHQQDLQKLSKIVDAGSGKTRNERRESLHCQSGDALLKKSQDWSEVRPEWGLAGNAVFIAAPRNWTQASQLAGRAFLHSYEHADDPTLEILEQIMTAPMVVAHWINMQYYASTVDPAYFGSGNKTIHNVVGNFGVLSGNSGDLMTGLPWQSIHDGRQYQHEPVRLLAVIAAPRQAIESVLAKHSAVRDILQNGWMHLVALENGHPYRFTERGSWDGLESSSGITHSCASVLQRSNVPT